MVIFITFCFVVIMQTFFYLFFFGKFSFAKAVKQKNKTLSVSIVICAKNEENNLKQNLPSIATQNYNSFEIVLVNDGSTDASLKVMQDFKAAYSSEVLSVKILNLENKASSGKKNALSLGIKATKNEYLILTDADCQPCSKNWISEISSNFYENKNIVLGYGAYQKVKHSFLNKLIRFETLLTAIQYFSYAKSGYAYMGVGRNIAYKKCIFKKVMGFDNHKHVQSGDDDLFIKEASNRENTNICFTKNSFTISEPHNSFKKWINQKRRHITTANHYKNFHKLSLGLFYLSQILFWLLAAILLTSDDYLFEAFMLIIFRMFIWYLIIGKSAKLLDEKDLVIFAPLFEISLIFMQLYIYIKNIISPPNQW